MVDLDQLLTEDFRLREFAVSREHPELAAQIAFTEEEAYKLFLLCTTILQPVRWRFGPVIVTSGKRPPLLNGLVGGELDSQHIYCEASDIVTPEEDMEQVHLWIGRSLNYAFGQAILYYDAEMKPKQIHVSLPSKRIRSRVRHGYRFGGTLSPHRPE